MLVAALLAAAPGSVGWHNTVLVPDATPGSDVPGAVEHLAADLEQLVPILLPALERRTQGDSEAEPLKGANGAKSFTPTDPLEDRGQPWKVKVPDVFSVENNPSEKREAAQAVLDRYREVGMWVQLEGTTKVVLVKAKNHVEGSNGELELKNAEVNDDVIFFRPPIGRENDAPWYGYLGASQA